MADNDSARRQQVFDHSEAERKPERLIPGSGVMKTDAAAMKKGAASK
jgi:hypothetical protein